MPKLIRETYEIVTPESAEYGDADERGWIDDEGEEFETVDDAIAFLRLKGADDASSSAFHHGIWYSASPETDFRTGAEETHSFHLSGFTVDEERAVYDGVAFRAAR